MVGDGSVEIIQRLAVALKLGATKHDLNTAIGIHPSSTEGLFSM
jgi:glutathione reductase (NADPH)